MNKAKIYELTMLYLQKQDLNKLSVPEFIEKFENTYLEIEKVLQESKTKFEF